MRENRTYGSEGGEPGDRASLPLSLNLKTGSLRTSLDVALEIRDVDGESGTRHLYFPHNESYGTPAKTAAVVFANEKGETRGGEYPEYAITDAANPRNPGGGPDLAIKNVTTHVILHGKLPALPGDWQRLTVP